MREKIRAAIQGGHKSVINGICSDKATDNVEKLFKVEISNILSELDNAADSPWDVYRAIVLLKQKYGIEG